MRIVLLATALLMATHVGAQTTPAPTPAPAPTPPPITGYTVSVNGGYSNVSNSPTNNGFTMNTEITIATKASGANFAIRGDVFVLQNPSVTLALVGPQFSFPATSLFKNPTSTVVSNTKFFANLKLGDAYSTGTPIGTNGITTQHKFAYGVGGGIEIALSSTVHLRPLDVTYVRSSILNGGVTLGNHLAAGATLGLQF